MTDSDIRLALAQATDDVEPAPDLLDRVRAGGRRRVVRRRVVLGGAIAAAVAAATSGPVLLRRQRPVTPPATKGDLRGDKQVIAEAIAAWNWWVKGPAGDAFGPAGPPRVVWAGSGPDGPAALVTQSILWRGIADDGDYGPHDWFGFCTRQQGEMTSNFGPAKITQADEPFAMPNGFDRELLLIVDKGHRLRYSGDYRIDGAGRVLRTFETLAPVPDGIRVIRQPRQPNYTRMALLRADTHAKVLAPRLGWDGPVRTPKVRMLPGSAKAWPAHPPAELLRQWSMDGRPEYHDAVGNALNFSTDWTIRGMAPDGRRFVFQTLTINYECRMFVFHGSDKPHYVGLRAEKAVTGIDGSSIMQVRLPGLGVVVGAEGASVRYRTRGGDWLPMSGDAGLLPEAAVELDIRPNHGKAKQIPLS